MNMALIASEPKGKQSTLKFEIDAETRQTLKLYMEFSGNAKHDPIMIGALKLLFKTDSDFAPWLEQHKHQQPAPASSPAGAKTVNSTTKHEPHK
jgi:hypothetical protein